MEMGNMYFELRESTGVLTDRYQNQSWLVLLGLLQGPLPCFSSSIPLGILGKRSKDLLYEDQRYTFL